MSEVEQKKKRGRPVKGQPKAITMNISMSVETREMLQSESDKTGESMAEIIRIALEKHFEN